MRSKAYSHITGMFVMNDKPEGPFDPTAAGFQELVRYALEKAFNDFNFRTLTKTAEFQKEYTAWEKEENTIRKQQKKEKRNSEPNPEPKMTTYLIKRLEKSGFLDRFAEYFRAEVCDQTRFDDWHNQTCELFLNVLDGTGEFREYTKAYTGLAYGKAQKIVNMMFKHLYCLNGAEAYQDYFGHCHMVLDNFTLEWFKREVGEKRIDSWSNLVYKKPSADYKDYLFYQEKIRNHFLTVTADDSVYAELTPFQAEFYIWPEIQLHLAAEAFLFELNPDTYKGKEDAPTRARAALIKLSAEELVAKAKEEIHTYEQKHT